MFSKFLHFHGHERVTDYTTGITYSSGFFDWLEGSWRSTWADAVSGNIGIDQLGNGDNTDTYINHNAKIYYIASVVRLWSGFHYYKRSWNCLGARGNTLIYKVNHEPLKCFSCSSRPLVANLNHFMIYFFFYYENLVIWMI